MFSSKFFLNNLINFSIFKIYILSIYNLNFYSILKLSQLNKRSNASLILYIEKKRTKNKISNNKVLRTKGVKEFKSLYYVNRWKAKQRNSFIPKQELLTFWLRARNGDYFSIHSYRNLQKTIFVVSLEIILICLW